MKSEETVQIESQNSPPSSSSRRKFIGYMTTAAAALQMWPTRARAQFYNIGAFWKKSGGTSGTMWFVGDYTYGEDGLGVSSTAPAAKGSGFNWAKVSTNASGNHTLGLTTSGALYGWGGNSFGQITGVLTSRYYYAPLTINSPNSYTQISAGGGHSMMIRTDGTLWGVGNKSYGQVGDGVIGSFSYSSSPVQIAGSWSQVVAGDTHTFGIKTDSTLWAWGYNGCGQLGTSNLTTYSTPTQVAGSWSQISTNGGVQSCSATTFTLALKPDGSLWSWGNNAFGQLGNGNTTSSSSPVQVGSNSWSQIATCITAGAAIRTDGTLWAWGDNGSGQLGNNSATTAFSSPVQVTGSWSQIWAGYRHFVGKQTDGTVWAWGWNGEGELANGDFTNRSSPVQFSGSWSTMSLGFKYSMAVSTGNAMSSWGIGPNGETLTWGYSSPVQVTSTSWQQFGGGPAANQVLAIDSSSRLFAWGSGSNGQNGYTGALKATPQQIAGSWLKVAGGSNFSFGIKSDSTVWFWGDNSNGQSGNGASGGGSSSPTQIQAGSWVSIACGSGHTLGLKADGTLYTWGYNTKGQCLAPLATSFVTQTQVPGSWTQMSAGGFHSFGIKTDGTLWGWGNSTSYQVSGSSDLSSPVQVAGSWLLVACGGAFTVGVKTDYTVWAWGANGFYQCLTNSGGANVSTPTQYAAGTSVSATQLVAGDSHGYILGLGGAVYSWGSNAYSQLGTDLSISPKVSFFSQITGSWAQVAAGANYGLLKKA